MAPSTPRRPSMLRATLAIADTASWYCSIVLVVLILLTIFRDTYPTHFDSEINGNDPYPSTGGGRLLDRPCDEIYVVGEGETLHTISDKCSDPFIVERNPHIHDPDDVFPGLVIRIVPIAGITNRKLLSGETPNG